MGELILDERGRRCPAPILAMGRALRALPSGSRVQLLADDPVASTDVPAWCRLVGATLFATVLIDERTTAFTITLP